MNIDKYIPIGGTVIDEWDLEVIMRARVDIMREIQATEYDFCFKT